MSDRQTKQFELGKQPEWAGREPNADVPLSFIESLLKEKNEYSLINRGYCVVELDERATAYYSKFHQLIESFFSSSQSEKEKYALLQFEEMSNSPNQCHGYSAVSNLKEQFMMRCIGRQNATSDVAGSDYVFPSHDFGKYGQLIYEKLDLLSRKLAKQCMQELGKAEQAVDDILDPIHKISCDVDVIDSPETGNNQVVSEFVPDDYVSSSIMDNFHYFAPSKEKHEKFFNNHSSHTDSGLVTVVIVTDEPGLEIYDQKTKQWLRIEHLLKQHLKQKGEYEKAPLCHRRYATIFWSDSVEYLNNAPVVNVSKVEAAEGLKLKPLFHRVADCERERYSVVFKQRTAPLRTHCRYQEDYILATIQQKVDKDSKNAYTLWKEKKNNELGWMYGSIALAVSLSAALCWTVLKKKQLAR